jgi:hypothetical protein
MLDIRATVTKHKDIVPQILAMHGLTGCATVGTYHGIGKVSALDVSKSGMSLSSLGEADTLVEEVMPQCTTFMLACYKQSKCRTMTEARHKKWQARIHRSTATAPKLRTLPPTDEAFKPNVARAHFQVSLWKNATNPKLTGNDARQYGWKEDDSKQLNPVTVPPWS